MRKRTMLAIGVTVGLAAAIGPAYAAQAAPKRTLSGSVPGWAKASALQRAADAEGEFGGVGIALAARHGGGGAQTAGDRTIGRPRAATCFHCAGMNVKER